MGGATLYGPDSVDLEVPGFSLMGGHTELGSQRSPRPGAPVIHVHSWNLMGGATIYRLPPQTRGLSLKEANALELFKNEGVAPDAERRVTEFVQKRRR